MPNEATITLRTRADLQALISARNSFNTLSSEEQKAERAALSLARSMAQLDAKMGNTAGAAQRLRTALRDATYIDPQQAIGALNQIISLEQKAAAEAARLGKAGGLQILPRTVESFGTQALDQFKSSLLGVVGPAALVTAGLGALSAAAQSFEDSFKFKAQLDETTKSIELQLRGVRDSGVTFQSAAAFAERYKFTQEETTLALRGSISVLRSSTSSAEDLLGVLARLQVLSPEQGLEGASLALKELQSGDIQSLVERFEVSRSAANKMKDEIKGGADAVQVLSKYLNDAGVGMEVLENRAKGAAGAMRDQARAQEELRLAQAQFAEGPGLAITEQKISAIQKATKGLSGDFAALGGQNISEQLQDFFGTTKEDADAAGLAYANFLRTITGGTPVIDESAASATHASTAFDAYRDAALGNGGAVALLTSELLNLTAEIEKNAQAATLAAGQSEAQKIATEALKAETNAAVNAFLALNPNIDASGIASEIAAGRVPKLVGELALLRIQSDDTGAALARLAAQQAGIAGVSALFAEGAGTQKGTTTGTGGRLGGGAGDILARNDAIAQSERDLALARAGSTQEQIRLLQEQANKTLDIVEKNKLLVRIEGLKNSLSKPTRGGTTGGRGLSTLDRTDIALAGDESAKLAEINRRLEQGNITELQRKQLLKDKLALEGRIADTILRQNEAALDARLLANRDQQDRINEDRELAGLKRRQASDEFTPEQKRAAALREEEILLERQKREINIQDKIRASGGIGAPVAPLAGAAIAGGVAAATPIAPSVAQTNAPATLGVFLDSREVGYVLIPEIMRAMMSGAATVQAAGG